MDNIERERLLDDHRKSGHQIQSVVSQSAISSSNQKSASSSNRRESEKKDDDDIDIKEEYGEPKFRNSEQGKQNAPLSPLMTPKTPRSPMQKVGTFITSPGRMVARQIEPGSVKASIFSLVIICLGAGTITIPYVYYENGIFLGTFFIFLGGSLSIFTGHLIGYCAYYTNGASYEEVAYNLYGQQGLRFTSFCNIICNLGFLLSYCVLFKTTMPKMLKGFGVETEILTSGEKAERFWLSLFCFGVLLWISLPRSLGALRYTSLASFMISIFLVGTIFILSFSSNSPNEPKQAFSERLDTAVKHNDVTMNGIFSSIPLIIFSYMYQPLIPCIYHELNNKSVKKMDKILYLGTGMASVAYILCGTFGYVTFANHRNVGELMEKQNILECYQHQTVIKVCQVGVIFMVLFASPFCVLPAKDSFEQLLLPNGVKFTFKKNFLCTLLIVIVIYGFAFVLESLAQVMTILGATTNSGIGFLIPIVFYLKVMDKQEQEEGQLGKDKQPSVGSKCMRWTCYFVFALICIQSIISIVTFIQSEMK